MGSVCVRALWETFGLQDQYRWYGSWPVPNPRPGRFDKGLSLKQEKKTSEAISESVGKVSVSACEGGYN